MIISFGNVYYLLYIIMGLLVTLLLVKHLNKKSESYRYYFIFGILVLSVLVHFLKIFIYPYTTLDVPLRKITLENICAVSTVLFPFIYLSKNKTLKDYMILAGLASGLLTFIYPIDAMSPMFDGMYLEFKSAFSIEVIRFYFTHLVLFLVPFLMMHYKMHELSVKRMYKMPLIFIIVLFVIFINEILLTTIGWVPKDSLYDPNKRNPSLIFGVKDGLEGLGLMVTMFVPYFLTVSPLTGEAFYWPVIWQIIPAYIYGIGIAFIFYMIYDREETKLYVKRKLRLIPKEELREQKKTM